MKNLNETMKLFVEHKPEFLDILGFESCSYNDANETYSCVFNPSSSLSSCSLSFIGKRFSYPLMFSLLVT